MPFHTMKKHHILLILGVAGTAAFFLNETRNLRSRESIAIGELVMLREAVRKSPGAATASILGGKSSRLPGIDPAKFTGELADILKNGPGAETQKSPQDFQTKYQAQLTSAPASQLKEICGLLEQSFQLDQPDAEMVRGVWLYLVGLAAKSDPAWAITKLDLAASAAKAPIDSVLGAFKSWASQNGGTLSLPYAEALRQWLDAAQAGGRIDESDPLVAELRAGIATARGDQSAAVKEMAQLSYQRQRKAAMDYVQGLRTPDARRQAIEELSTALQIQNFPQVVRELADQQGFDAAREILGSASLTPEKHDLAAAGIAAANIGPETPAKAKWLLESLRSRNGRAVTVFMEQWTHADYNGAAQWINTLTPGGHRDAAIAAFAPVAAKIDGASAVDWALTLADPAGRESTLGAVYQIWQRTDPAAAAAYLREKGIAAK
jgi:hypothetical protein